MKVLTYNVYNGLKEDERFEDFIAFINKEDPHVLLLQELVGWQDNNFNILHSFLRKTIFDHYRYLSTDTGFDIATFSKKPIRGCEKLKSDLHHGALIVTLSDLHICNLHLNPFSESERVKEVKKILSHLHRKNILVGGDFNSLSKKDEYDKEKLIESFNKTQLAKFGEEKILFDCIQVVERTLNDMYINYGSGKGYTVPTGFNEDDAHMSKLRLDYFFGRVIGKDVIDVKVLRNRRTERISDHYPVLLEYV